jgi:hypothetical protein
VKTPSSAHTCKCTCRFRLEPKRCTKMGGVWGGACVDAWCLKRAAMSYAPAVLAGGTRDVALG